MPEEIIIERTIERKTATAAEDIRLNETQAIQTILGHPPSWILRWGISLVAMFVVVLAVMSWLIKYPDVIMAEVMLTTEQPPIRVVANTGGRLDKWLVEDQTEVKRGEVLAEFFNTAKVENVLALSRWLSERVEGVNSLEELPRSVPKGWELGELQNSFSTFSEGYKDLLYFGNAAQVAIKVQSLHHQIQHIEQLTISQQKQLAIFQKETQLALKDFERYQYLYQEKGCTQVELETKELNYLQHQRQAENLQSGITNNELQVEQLRLQIAELEQGQTDGVVNKLVTVKEQARRLQSEINGWKERYLVIAPISGVVSLSNVRAAQQFVNANTEILTIVPPDTSNAIVARAVMPTEGAGKVKSGMEAVISFANYPSQEFGTVTAKVGRIALIPQKGEEASGYELVLEDLGIGQGIGHPAKGQAGSAGVRYLETNYNKTIDFQQEMQGTAKIITEDRRVMERVMDKLVSMVRQQD